MIELPDFLNPDLLDRAEEIREQFQTQGWVAIPNYLSVDVADSLYKSLDEHTPWFLEIREGANSPKRYSHEEYSGLSEKAKLRLVPKQKRHSGRFDPSKVNSKQNSTNATGGAHFEYAFARFDLLPETYRGNEETLGSLATVYFGFHSEVYHEFIRHITGVERKIDVSAQFSNYSKGHYASLHSDLGTPTEKERIVAHVLALSRDWDSTWGGEFCFCDKNGKIFRKKPPSFNTLAMFKLPMLHKVMPVKTYAKRNRYSVFGWVNAMD